jgi:hypothetical protein
MRKVSEYLNEALNHLEEVKAELEGNEESFTGHYHALFQSAKATLWFSIRHIEKEIDEVEELEFGGQE